MSDIEFGSESFDISRVHQFITAGKPLCLNLKGPSQNGREYLKNIIIEYLKQLGKETSFSLVCLCMEEIISNSVKANVKRAYFIANHLDINKHDDYEIGMKNFREAGIGLYKEKSFIKNLQELGFYVNISFYIANNIFYITTRNNSVISQEEIARIEKKLKLSENKTPEDIFMNSIDTTEGAGLGIIMIKKIMNQVSTLPDCFSISATDTETVTELKIK